MSAGGLALTLLLVAQADVAAPTPQSAPQPANAVVPSVMQVAVAPVQADAAAKGVLPTNIDDIILQAVQVSGRFDVVGQSDIRSMLDHEANSVNLGCSADATSCMNEIASALGVDQLVAVEVAQFDAGWVVTTKLVDVKKANVIARQRIDVDGGPRALVDGVVTGVRRLFDPTWRAPERPVLTPSLIASVGAGALVVAAAGSGVWALSSVLQRNGRYDAYQASAAPVDVQAFNDAVAADSQMWLATWVAVSCTGAAVGAGSLAMLLRGIEEEQ